MKLINERIKLPKTKELQLINLTEKIQDLINKYKLINGFVLVFVPGSTAALTTMEFEPGLEKDFPAFLEKIIPKNEKYYHELSWHDGNGHSHVRAALLKPDLSIPFSNFKLDCGLWQQIIFIELDVRERQRELIVKLFAE